MGYSHFLTVDHDHPGWGEALARASLDGPAIVAAAAALGIHVAAAYCDDYVAERLNRPERPVPPIFPEGMFSERGIWIAPMEADGTLGYGEFLTVPSTVPDEEIYDFEREMGGDSGGTWTDYVKTGQRPYDLVVTSVLLRLAIHGWSEHGPECVSINSDGDWFSDWLPARHLCAELFDEPMLLSTHHPVLIGQRLPGYKPFPLPAS